jgi:DNA-binding transcriptional ArsR family regulator
MQPEKFFSELVERINGDYTAAAVLLALLDQQADLAFVSLSYREIAAMLGNRVLYRTVPRAIRVLQDAGLIELKEHPQTTTRYRVDADALRALLAQPQAPANVIPGITPLPALSRIFGEVPSMNQEGVIDEQ